MRKEPILQEVNKQDFPREANKREEACFNISEVNFMTKIFNPKYLISSLRDKVRWQLRSASAQMRMKRSYGN